VESIRRSNLPAGLEAEKPQQRALAKSIGPEAFLTKAAAVFGWPEEAFRSGRRLRGTQKQERDLVIYWLWNSGRYKNEEIARPLGMTPSALSHCVRQTRSLLEQEEALVEKLAALNSQFKV